MALPAYHEIDQLSISNAASSLSSIQLTETEDPTDVSFSLIGGSGVRVPLLPDERESYDRRVISQLRGYGVIERHNMDYPPNSPLRM